MTSVSSSSLAQHSKGGGGGGRSTAGTGLSPSSSFPSLQLPPAPGPLLNHLFSPNKPCVCVEFGQSTVKIGFSGEALPRAVLKSPAGLIEGLQRVGMVEKRGGEEEETEEDWLYLKIVDYFEMLYFRYLLVQPNERRLVLTCSHLSGIPAGGMETVRDVLLEGWFGAERDKLRGRLEKERDDQVIGRRTRGGEEEEGEDYDCDQGKKEFLFRMFDNLFVQIVSSQEMAVMGFKEKKVIEGEEDEEKEKDKETKEKKSTPPEEEESRISNTGLVVDLGSSDAVILAVYEGVPLVGPRGVRWTRCGSGGVLEDLVVRQLVMGYKWGEEKRRRRKGKEGGAEEEEVLELPDWFVKEVTCQVFCFLHAVENSNKNGENGDECELIFELPSGRRRRRMNDSDDDDDDDDDDTVRVSVTRAEINAVLKTAGIGWSGDNRGEGGVSEYLDKDGKYEDMGGVAELILDVLSKVPIDCRRELAQRVMVVGGMAQLLTAPLRKGLNIALKQRRDVLGTRMGERNDEGVGNVFLDEDIHILEGTCPPHLQAWFGTSLFAALQAHVQMTTSTSASLTSSSSSRTAAAGLASLRMKHSSLLSR
eukprot:Nk52_evm8s212 gene=Nk52_evmTU8s212